MMLIKIKVKVIKSKGNSKLRFTGVSGRVCELTPGKE